MSKQSYQRHQKGGAAECQLEHSMERSETSHLKYCKDLNIPKTNIGIPVLVT